MILNSWFFVYKLLVTRIIIEVANLALLLANSEGTYLKAFFKTEGGKYR